MSQTPSRTLADKPQWQKWCVSIVITIVVLVVAGCLLLHLLARAFAHAPSIDCLQNLKSIHYAATVWADERHTNRLPDEFILFTNHLHDPKVLRCQIDYGHQKISVWSELTHSNISYVINTNGGFMDSTNEYVVCPLHHFSVKGYGLLSHRYKWIDGAIVPRK